MSEINKGDIFDHYFSLLSPFFPISQFRISKDLASFIGAFIDSGNYMPVQTRMMAVESSIQDLSSVVAQHSEALVSIKEALTNINQKLHDISIHHARSEKQPLLPTPTTPNTHPNNHPNTQPAHLTQHDNHHTHPRLPRLEVPLFNGEGVSGWLFQIEHFFHIHFTPPDQRLIIATFYMTGPALDWFQFMSRTHELPNWETFRRELEICFGPSSFINHEANLFKLNQTSTAREFETLSTNTPTLSTSNLLNCFISGLREDIKRELFIHKPSSFSEAIGLAKLIEAKAEVHRSYPRPPSFHRPSNPPYTAQTSNPPYTAQPSNTSTSTNPRPPNRPTLPTRRLTNAEMSDRQSRGLCYNCDERWFSGHRCKPKYQCILVDEDTDESVPMLRNPHRHRTTAITHNPSHRPTSRPIRA